MILRDSLLVGILSGKYKAWGRNSLIQFLSTILTSSTITLHFMTCPLLLHVHLILWGRGIGNFSAGQGTLQYSARSPLRPVNTPLRGFPDLGTGETSNAVYSPMANTSAKILYQRWSTGKGRLASMKTRWGLVGIILAPSSTAPRLWSNSSTITSQFTKEAINIRRLFISPDSLYVIRNLCKGHFSGVKNDILTQF